jgi:hypothetical protein
MNKGFGATAIVVVSAVAAAGLFAGPSDGSRSACSKPLACSVSLTASGPSPSTLTAPAASYLTFDNTDSMSHTVVFANGHCSLTLTPGEDGGQCMDNFSFFVGDYPYTVDGKFAGAVVTTPLRRSVNLTARTHTIRHGTRLTLHGHVSWFDYNPMLPREQFRVTVLARQDGRQAFKPITTGRVWSTQPYETRPGSIVEYGWKRKVHPGVTTTYIAEVTAQPWIWSGAKSRPFTIRTRKG